MENQIEVLVGNCVDILPDYANQADLILTSPPYGTMREYEGQLDEFVFEDVAAACYEALAPSGVMVWVVGDQSVKHSLTLNPMRQAIFFTDELKLNMIDVMIYQKTWNAKVGRKYLRAWEYMFIMSKDIDYTFNPLEDRKNKYGGHKNWGQSGQRDKDGTLRLKEEIKTVREYGRRSNIWKYYVGSVGTNMGEPGFNKLKHPAMMPYLLAQDHIKSWTNEGDLVIDPMCGSGTTLSAANALNRRAVGIDVVKEYAILAKKRVTQRSLN